MNFDFDYKSFQNESQKKLAQIYAESFEGDEDIPVEKIDETYNKIQKILECPEMEKSHPYLYSLDMENVNEDDEKKINAIYDLAVSRGIIDEVEKEIKGDDVTNECDDVDSSLCGGPSDALTGQEMKCGEKPEAPINNFTVLYSGMKDGTVKTGEFYSQATDIESAKEDCMSSMTSAGYTDMRVLAIEQNVQGVVGGVKDEPAGVDYYDVYREDDSAEFEKQETGDEDTEVKEEPAKEEPKKEEEPKKDEEKPDVSDKGSEGDEKDDGSEKDDKTEKQDEPDSEETDGEEDSEEEKQNDDADKDEELTAEQKTTYKDEYTKLFKATLKKMKLGKSVQDMSLEEKTNFWTELAKKWTKADPSKFLSDKDQEKLNKTVVKQDEEEK